MGNQFSEIMFTEAIKRLQERAGSRRSYEKFALSGKSNDQLLADEVDFISQRDSFYIASEGENGWPYIQHRGGPKGFLKVVDTKTLAFADYSGNKQYITAGNVTHNDRVTIFLMDYPHQTRLKVLGHAQIVEAKDDAKLWAEVAGLTQVGKAERVFKIKVVAFDWNCPQYITPRFTEEELLEEMQAMTR